MILLLSSHLESSTDKIEDWLCYYGHKYLRLNTTSLIPNIVSINLRNSLFYLQDGTTLNPRDFNVVFRRKWYIHDFLRNELNNIDAKTLISLRTENSEIANYFKNCLCHAKWIDDENRADLNKLDQLRLARRSGLTVPETLVTSNKNQLADFLKEHKRIITKPLLAHMSFEKEDALFATYTSVITENFFQNLPEHFYPSLFQEYVEKEFEIRVVFVNDKVFSLAYFSQQEEATSIDYRNPSGMFKFKTEVVTLPSEITSAIKTFMDLAGLSTGSIDLIYRPNGEFVFLEINPCGIFENVSYFGNFNIEEEFAKLLMKHDNTAVPI